MRIYFWLYIFTVMVLSSCSAANHGTFVTSTFFKPSEESAQEFVGRVVGESSQTWFLYLFPIGEAPTTNGAISNAKASIEGTKYLADMSIDNRTSWKIGYSKQIIRVEASAYK